MHARVISERALVYTDAADADLDRPPHVRAASAIAVRGDELYIVQDDAAFIARVRGDEVTAIALPAGPGGRRRFESSLGNKLDKLDLESCVILDDELVAFGSGTLPIREHVVRMRFDGVARVEHARELYAQLRAALGGPLNIEGVACVDDVLWFCHRGNTHAGDAPAILRVERSLSRVLGCERVDLGQADGVALGFTDACGIPGGIAFLATAEASDNAIDDGRVLASLLGAIDRDGLRTIPLALAGKPEAIAITTPDRAWITVDVDDPAVPTTLYELEINLAK